MPLVANKDRISMGNSNKTNIFLCVTEYHVLLSILIATEVYGTEEFCNQIVLCNGGRFDNMSRYDISPIQNINYRKVDKDYINSRNFVEDNIKSCTGELFLFNMNYKHFIYIAYRLKKDKNVLTSFVQEGLASYGVLKFSKHKIISDLRSSMRLFKSIGVKDFSFYRFCFGFRGRYGRVLLYYKDIIENSLINAFWLTSPDGAKYGKNKLKAIPNFSEKSLAIADSLFMYEKDDLQLRKNDILFVDQNRIGSFHFISELSKQIPAPTIYIKLHPSAPKSLAIEYKKIDNVNIINNLNGVPIDLLIQKLKEVVVITPYSSALLIDNPSCRYYYMYPWLLDNGYGQDIPIESIYNPTRFIREINKVTDIVLFND